MEHYHGPKRRRVGVADPDGLVHVPIRLTREAKDFIKRLRAPGVLAPRGCSHGDVIVIAVRELAERNLPHAG